MTPYEFDQKDYAAIYSDPARLGERCAIGNQAFIGGFLRSIFGGNKSSTSTRSETRNESSYRTNNISPAQEVGAGGSATNLATPIENLYGDASTEANINVEQVAPGYADLLGTAERLFDNTFEAIDGQLDIFARSQASAAALAGDRHARASVGAVESSSDTTSLIKQAIIPIAVGAVLVAFTGKKFW